MLKDKDVTLQTKAIESLRQLATTKSNYNKQQSPLTQISWQNEKDWDFEWISFCFKDPKLASYLRLELLERMTEMIIETIPRRTEKSTKRKGQKKTKSTNQNENKKASVGTSESQSARQELSAGTLFNNARVLIHLTSFETTRFFLVRLEQKAARERIFGLWEAFVKTGLISQNTIHQILTIVFTLKNTKTFCFTLSSFTQAKQTLFVICLKCFLSNVISQTSNHLLIWNQTSQSSESFLNCQRTSFLMFTVPSTKELEKFTLMINCCVDVATRSLLIGCGVLRIFLKFIQSTDVEVACHFMECLKQFFTVGMKSSFRLFSQINNQTSSSPLSASNWFYFVKLLIKKKWSKKVFSINSLNLSHLKKYRFK